MENETAQVFISLFLTFLLHLLLPFIVTFARFTCLRISTLVDLFVTDANNTYADSNTPNVHLLFPNRYDRSIMPLCSSSSRSCFMNKLAAVAEELGREIRVFTNSAAINTSDKGPATSISNSEEHDDFYEFTGEDYYRLLSSRKEDNFLKTRKIREMEEAARRSRITKAVIRVHFPDNYILEAKFHPSETISSLVDLLTKVVARPDLPFYIYTTPPKKKINDISQDFYSAGFAPGAIVYFSYDLQTEEDRKAANAGPFLREDIVALNGLDATTAQTEEAGPATEPVLMELPPPKVEEPKPAKKPVKPKWLKM